MTMDFSLSVGNVSEETCPTDVLERKLIKCLGDLVGVVPKSIRFLVNLNNRKL